MLCAARLDQAIALLQRRGRVTCRARKRQCTMPTLRACFLLCALLTLLLAPSSPPLHAQPLVLLHGHPFNRTMWRPQTEHFRRAGRIGPLALEAPAAVARRWAAVFHRDAQQHCQANADPPQRQTN